MHLAKMILKNVRNFDKVLGSFYGLGRVCKNYLHKENIRGLTK